MATQAVPPERRISHVATPDRRLGVKALGGEISRCQASKETNPQVASGKPPQKKSSGDFCFDRPQLKKRVCFHGPAGRPKPCPKISDLQRFRPSCGPPASQATPTLQLNSNTTRLTFSSFLPLAPGNPKILEEKTISVGG